MSNGPGANIEMSNYHEHQERERNYPNTPALSAYKYPCVLVKSIVYIISVYSAMGNRSGRRAQVNPPYGGGGYYGRQLTSTYLPYPRGNYNRCNRYPRPRPYY